jgi:DNA invertase Pin-like site-specific DNA recombinase
MLMNKAEKIEIIKNIITHKDRKDPVRIVFYGRVSTEHETQLSALEAQMQWYDDQLNYYKNWKLVDKYIDKGITGTQAKKRPAFLRMLEDAKKGKFDLIVTREVCRFARNTVQSLDTVQKLKKLGIEVYFVSDGIWSFDGDAELRLGIMSTLAQEESRKISDRVRAGQKISRDNGVLYGNGNILGYSRKIGETYKIVEEEAETVRMIFKLYLQGLGYSKICKELEKGRRKCATGKVTWSASKISRIINNPTYKGWIAYGKSITTDYLNQDRITITDADSYEYKKGDFEAIISEEDWNKAEEIRKSKTMEVNSPENKEERKKGKKPAQDIWLKKLRCSCGSSFRKNKWRVNKTGEAAFGYQCYNQVNNGSKANREKLGLDTDGYCDIRMVADWKLDLIAKSVIEEVWTDRMSAVIEAYSMVIDCYESESQSNQEAVKKIKGKISALEEKIEKFIDMRADGEISKEQFMKSKEKVDIQIRELEQQLSRYEGSENEEKDNLQIELACIKETFENAIDFSKDKLPDGVIDNFIERIVVQKNDTFEVDINLQNSYSQTIICGVEGRKNSPKFSLKEGSDASPTLHSEQHRQRSTILGVKTETAEKPLKLGTFVIRKDYLSEYRKYHPETKKVNGWKDIVLIITF